MRRKKKKYAKERYSYKEIKPWLFWYECQACGHEFRREPIHKISMRWTRKSVDGSFGVVMMRTDGGSEWSDWYFCTGCCRSEVEARDYFERKVLPYYR